MPLRPCSGVALSPDRSSGADERQQLVSTPAQTDEVAASQQQGKLGAIVGGGPAVPVACRTGFVATRRTARALVSRMTDARSLVLVHGSILSGVWREAPACWQEGMQRQQWNASGFRRQSGVTVCVSLRRTHSESHPCWQSREKFWRNTEIRRKNLQSGTAEIFGFLPPRRRNADFPLLKSVTEIAA
ncbi:MAG: hypothetical protein ACK6EB_48105, partial [Planctomyces sp.]